MNGEDKRDYQNIQEKDQDTERSNIITDNHCFTDQGQGHEMIICILPDVSTQGIKTRHTEVQVVENSDRQVLHRGKKGFHPDLPGTKAHNPENMIGHPGLQGIQDTEITEKRDHNH